MRRARFYDKPGGKPITHVSMKVGDFVDAIEVSNFLYARRRWIANHKPPSPHNTYPELPVSR